jgi:hypothetical protein
VAGRNIGDSRHYVGESEIGDAQGEHPVTTPADWARRRAHILLGMQQAMGKLPDRSKLGPLQATFNSAFVVVLKYSSRTGTNPGSEYDSRRFTGPSGWPLEGSLACRRCSSGRI